ncbi:MAG: HD domain-containing protein [Deltaproteobacteria bacterium]|jgi:(p)ppGpp synthase/HD superfamily hydrolase|nr:HD domain-containing protein [Deltaproteobacteria bacterium]
MSAKPPKPEKETTEPLLGPRFTDALSWGAELHRHQVRKGSDVPYLAHLLSVAALVLEHGGDEDVAIAAVLHDAVEDQGGQPILDEIGRRFGARAADIVLGVSDSVTAKGALKAPWRDRKEKYLVHFAEASADVRLVSMADKLHNARSTVSDLRREGPRTWDKFNATREDTLWFYRRFADLAKTLDRRAIVDELELVVRDLERVG